MKGKMLKLTHLILGLALILGMFGPAWGAADPAEAKAHPLLMQMAAEEPEQQVAVIVQKRAREADFAPLVAQLGGEITKDLHIINAFVAEMPAEAALKLARNDGVRWVSLDAAVERSGKPVANLATFTLRDDFVEPSYFNNDGTAGWKTEWLEEDIAGAGPTTGNIQIVADRLVLHDRPDTGTQPAITRAFDLSDGVTAATLSYIFSLGPGVDLNEDLVALEISSNGGLTYSTLQTFNSTGNTSGSGFQNILTYASADTRLRFRVESGYGGTDEFFALDYIQIDYTGNALPKNNYLDTLRVPQVWNMGINGAGIGVAVIDSGITKEKDLGQSVKLQMSLNQNSSTVLDRYGHGTHIAGIIASNGSGSGGIYYGVAPGVNLYSLKVSDDSGMAYESDVVQAIQWVYDNKDRYNIRVANLSINSTVYQSYHTSPLDAAVEILWFNGVVVVASVGNMDESNGYLPFVAAPADDPFVITVGASDEKGNTRRRDDVMANFSIDNLTSDFFLKPEILAPGKDIISLLASSSDWDVLAPERVVAGKYFRLSGTSMAAPMVTGAVALLLQDEPNLTPDQVKYRLIHSAPDHIANIPYLDVYAAVTGTTMESANTGITASQLLWSGSEPITWGSVAWNSVAWNSVAWNSVAWNSVAWNSVAWNSVYWGP